MDIRHWVAYSFVAFAFTHSGCTNTGSNRPTVARRVGSEPASLAIANSTPSPTALKLARTTSPTLLATSARGARQIEARESSARSIASGPPVGSRTASTELATRATVSDGSVDIDEKTSPPTSPSPQRGKPVLSRAEVLLASAEDAKLTVPKVDGTDTRTGSTTEVAPAPQDIPLPSSVGAYVPPPRATTSILPIDLPTVIRLVNVNSPLVGFTQAKAREAYARAEAADLLWLPNLSVGTAYNRFDGQTQNQAGNIFSVSRSNLFMNGGVSLNLDTSEAFYRPLIESSTASAEARRAQASNVLAELEATLAYFDLLHAHEQLEVNTSSLERAETLLVAARNAQTAKADRSPGDTSRVKTEVLLRRQERYDLESRCASASARLARLILVDPRVRLVPQVAEAVPITLVDPQLPTDELLALASYNRQELGASADQITAAWERVRRAKYGPLFPKLQVADQVGGFGGGTNSDLQDFRSRNTLGAMMYWELKNLGFGNQAEVRERAAGLDQANFQQVELRARVASEVIEAAEVALAKSKALQVSQEAVAEAEELYRINREGTFNVVDSKNLFDALRPLQAIQILHQARLAYVAAVLDFSRAQFRLHAALGRPGVDMSPASLSTPPTTTPSRRVPPAPAN